MPSPAQLEKRRLLLRACEGGKPCDARGTYQAAEGELIAQYRAGMFAVYHVLEGRFCLVAAFASMPDCKRYGLRPRELPAGYQATLPVPAAADGRGRYDRNTHKKGS